MALTRYAIETVDRKRKCLGFFLDLLKAFDTSYIGASYIKKNGEHRNPGTCVRYFQRLSE